MEQKQSRLTPQELNEVIQMAQQIYQIGYYNAFSPQMSNQLLTQRTGGGATLTADSVRKILANANKDSIVIREYNSFAQVYSSLYSRTLDYYANMLSFDYTIAPLNADWDKINNDPKKLAEYKEDEERIYKFASKWNYERDFRTIVKKALLNGKFFGWFRNSITATENLNPFDNEIDIRKTSHYAIQEMPFNYCLITGQDEYQYLYDIDMNYFLMAGVDINTFDPIFRKYIRDVFTYDGEQKRYIPSAQPCQRNGVFGQWHQTSMNDGAICVVADYSNPEAPPFLTPLVGNILTDDEIAKLQINADILSAKGILYGEIPLMTNQKSGQVADAMAWNDTTLIKFMSLVKAGLGSSLNSVAMPTVNNKFAQYDLSDTKDMYNNQLLTTAGNAASANRIIYSSDRASQEELRLQVQTDFNRVKNIYTQLSAIFEYYANKCTRNYKFAIRFSGSNYDFLREADNKSLLDLADRGIVLHPTAYASIVKMPSHIFVKSLEAGHYSGMSNLLTSLMSIHTASASSGQGRPTLDVEDRSESGNANYD